VSQSKFEWEIRQKAFIDLGYGTRELCKQTQPSNTVVAVFKIVGALLWKFHG